MTEGEDWLDIVRASLLRDYRLGNVVPPPMPTPSLGPLDLVGPKPTRLNQLPEPYKTALLHRRNQSTFDVPQSPMPPQAPISRRDPDMPEAVPPMPPIAPVAPPMPTPNPMRVPQPERLPSGGFGATGNVSSAELERRLQPNPVQEEDRWFAPPNQITNMPERSPLDQAIEQLVIQGLGFTPAGRGFKALQAARAVGPSIVPKVARGARSLTDELQAIHRAAPKYKAPPRPRKDWSLTGEQLARKKAYYNSPTYQNKRLISQLGTKGKLDARTGRLIEEADAPVSMSHWWIK